MDNYNYLEIEQAFNSPSIDNFHPNKKVAILTCMDPRITPDSINHSSDAYIIRNAGGRASSDSIRSLIISHKLLHTSEWYVIQHTDCGMQKFNNKIMDCLLKHSLEPSTLVKDCNKNLNNLESVCACEWKDIGKCPGKDFAKHINWLPILNGLEDSVIEDVKKIRYHPLVPPNIPIYGFIYDIENNKLIPVPKANCIGQAKPLKCCRKNECNKICKCCKKC